MTETRLLLVVIAVVYVWECVYWFRRGMVAFSTGLSGVWRALHPAALLGNQSGGLIFANPLPPLGELMASAQWPLSISADGIFSYVAQCVSPGWRPVQPAQFVAFDDIKKIEPWGKQVRVDGRVFIRAGSTQLAAFIAAKLRAIQKLPKARREAAVREMFRDSLSIKTIKARLEGFNRRSRGLRIVANLLFVYLFIVAPMFLWRGDLAGIWIPLVAGLLALTATAAFLFYRAHRVLYPEADEERLTHWILILLSPASSVRACDALSRPLLEPFHPLAVACAFLPSVEFEMFARRTLLELRHPCLPVCPVSEPAPRLAESQSRAALLEAVETFLKDNRLDPAALAKPPKPAEAENKSFCPRCESQFTTSEGTCEDCGGIPLVPFK